MQVISLHSLLGYLGGLLVVIYIVGYLVVSCLTINSYQDHMVQTLYPTKKVLKERLRLYLKQFPEKEQERYKDILEDPAGLEDDER